MNYGDLTGIRVLDLGIVTAGASASAILADLGAEVIKIEGPSYIDPFRGWMGTPEGTTWWEESAPFIATNRNKKSVCLDLKAPKGRELFLSLVEKSDIVLENFRADVLDRLGIGYEILAERNPRIILVSLTSQGKTGPNATKVSFGSSLEASSGLAFLTRYPGETPKISGRALNYPDQVVSLFAAGAVMTAFIDRLETGRGCKIDFSQRELSSFLIGESVVAAIEGSFVDPYPVGPLAYFQEIVKAKDGRWVAVTIPLDAKSDVEAIIGGEADKDAIRRWIEARDSDTIILEIRKNKIAAEIVMAGAMVGDTISTADGNSLGVDDFGRPVKGLPMRIGGQDISSFSSVPSLGFHNFEIAMELLGLSQSQYESLCDEKIFSDRPAN